ncbi:MAG: dihydroorotase [Verrucomicrobiae bacterium]|nr:dihydroorotase [Verrucomicrobiae bacterium]
MSHSSVPILFRGGEIASEDSPFLQTADVLVEGGRIARVGTNLEAPEGAEVIDCSGCVLMPAMYDVHVHAREPGQEHKETIETCSEAAINGGVTGMILMPNTVPAIDTGGLVQTVLDIAAAKSRIQVLQTGCITKGRAGEELAAIAGMAAKGVPMLTDDGDPVPDPRLLRRAMEYAKDFGLPCASHCEVKSLSGKGSINEGPASYRLGLPGIPAISEEICLDRDIRVAQYAGAHVHIQHVTTARGMETIRRAKEDGVKVTCEVAPHHLIFNEDHIVDYDTNYKMNPPLRTAEDNARLLQGLIDGVFDVIATDHAPHSHSEKRNNDFGGAPFGITGLETAVVSLYHHFIKPGRFGWDLLVRRYSAEPRRLIGQAPVPVVEEGEAEFIVVSTGKTTTFTREFMRSKSHNTPFIDQTLDGQIVGVVRGGKVLLNR